MISELDKATIIRLARKYDVSCVILFGSSLADEREANDIDLGVKGVKPGLFFRFYGELFKDLSKPVDLVNLSLKSSFNDLVEEGGVKIYG